MDIDRNRRTFMAAAVGTVALTGVATAQENASENATGNVSEEASGSGSDRAPTTHTVEMVTDGSTYLFDPVGLHVQPGDTVEFVLSSGTHSATAYEDRIPEDADAFDSGTLVEQGATYEVTFDVEGTYDYYCTPHKSLGMVARIVVGEPGGPAEESSIPDPIAEGELPSSDTIVEEGSITYPYTADTGDDGGGGGGGGAEELHEIGVAYQAHFVGIGAIFGVMASLVFAFYFLKYAESPEHTDQRDR